MVTLGTSDFARGTSSRSARWTSHRFYIDNFDYDSILEKFSAIFNLDITASEISCYVPLFGLESGMRSLRFSVKAIAHSSIMDVRNMKKMI